MRLFTLVAIFIMACSHAEENLLSFNSVETGFPDIFSSASEVSRSEITSTLDVPGFHQRSSRKSRWLLCVYTNIAFARGFAYHSVIYPEAGNEKLIIGFAQSDDEVGKSSLGMAFQGKNVLPLSSVDKLRRACSIMGYKEISK